MVGTSIYVFQQLSDKYLDVVFGKMDERRTFKSWQREHLGWQATTSYPTAGWHKGDLTTSLMLFCFSPRFWGRTLGTGCCVMSEKLQWAINRYINFDVLNLVPGLSQSRAHGGDESWSSISEAFTTKMAMESFGAGGNACGSCIKKYTHYITSSWHMQGRCRSRGLFLNVLCTSVSNGRRFHWTWEPIVAARRFRFYYVLLGW